MGASRLKQFIPSAVWKELRLFRILRTHSRVAGFCESLIEDFYKSGQRLELKPLKPELVGRKVIWQYWAQGYDQVPEIVGECLSSVEKYKGDYCLVRLTDDTVSEYIDIPEEAVRNSRNAGLAFYSDLLRVALLSLYGGVWLDATVMLCAPLRDRMKGDDFFMFQRDTDAPDKKYWEGTYAYYFGWRKGFRVNVLNSVIYAKTGSVVINDMCGLLMKFWTENATAPDYFFFQILFDVLINGKLKGMNCSIQSDCLPHYLQQYRNDPSFSLAKEDEILRMIETHKLTYKHE